MPVDVRRDNSLNPPPQVRQKRVGFVRGGLETGNKGNAHVISMISNRTISLLDFRPSTLVI